MVLRCSMQSKSSLIYSAVEKHFHIRWRSLWTGYILYVLYWVVSCELVATMRDIRNEFIRSHLIINIICFVYAADEV
ncbi:unnamed protein product [Schistosoma mansoni]|uniref:Smp_206230 n=1 Tax=Schistosoma mansoni TaxID=6183 RepID=UPI00022C874A|nr:unnamed protein product [Schistosoma mansoni]XP_018644825.1 unnamed protein product [Schistosoma mansoni]|eukprot:XP_018644824.1 unnamed protein product [Schistosoma mansoni]